MLWLVQPIEIFATFAGNNVLVYCQYEEIIVFVLFSIFPYCYTCTRFCVRYKFWEQLQFRQGFP